MNKVSFIRRLYYMIINFLKMLFLYIVKFFLIIFGMEEKEKKVNEEIIVVTKNLKNDKKEIKEPNYVVPVDPSSLVVDTGSKPEDQKNMKEQVIYKHISNQKDGKVRIYTVTLENIDKIINQYIEKKEEINLKKINKELKEDIKEWKEEHIVPQVKIELEKKYIENNDILVECVENIVEKELEIQHKKIEEKIVQNKTIEKRTFKNKDNLIVDFKGELNHLKPKEEIKEVDVTEREVVNELNNIVSDVSVVSERENITSENIIEKEDKIDLKEEINNILLTSALIVDNVEKVLVEKKKEKKKKVKEEKKESPVIIEDPLKEGIIEEKKEVIPPTLQEETELEIELPKLKVNETKVVIEDKKPEVTKTEDVKEEIKVSIDKEDKIDSIEELEEEEIVQVEVKEVKKEEQIVQQEEIIIKQVDLPYIDITDDEIISKARDESYKEDIEDRDYDSLENKIDEALEKIDMFIVMNEDKLTEKQLEQLNKEKQKLEYTKEKINKQREFDIEVEKKDLEISIQQKEINGLQEQLRIMELENKKLLQNNLINSLDDLAFMSDKNAREIEKKLLKLKLREACRAMSIPSLFALPFIRNKYFFFFTVGLFVNRNLSFIGDVFRRKSIERQEEDLNNLTQGKDALNGALDMMRENIDYLNVLEEQAKFRYPELMKDSEYLSYLNSLKFKLQSNYNRLTRRQNTIDKLIYRTKKNVHVLKRKKDKYKNVA